MAQDAYASEDVAMREGNRYASDPIDNLGGLYAMVAGDDDEEEASEPAPVEEAFDSPAPTPPRAPASAIAASRNGRIASSQRSSRTPGTLEARNGAVAS